MTTAISIVLLATLTTTLAAVLAQVSIRQSRRDVAIPPGRLRAFLLGLWAVQLLAGLAFAYLPDAWLPVAISGVAILGAVAVTLQGRSAARRRESRNLGAARGVVIAFGLALAALPWIYLAAGGRF